MNVTEKNLYSHKHFFNIHARKPGQAGFGGLARFREKPGQAGLGGLARFGKSRVKPGLVVLPDFARHLCTFSYDMPVYFFVQTAHRIRSFRAVILDSRESSLSRFILPGLFFRSPESSLSRFIVH